MVGHTDDNRIPYKKKWRHGGKGVIMRIMAAERRMEVLFYDNSP
jgi:hypothetical protein